MPSAVQVFLYIPNIIGYFRLVLLALALYYIDNEPRLFLSFYVSSVILDGFDGYFARLLGQTSAFGAWFDVVIDNIGRTMLWSHVQKWGWMMVCLEWLAFVCTHSLGASWKNANIRTQPIWVQAIMANDFKTPLGVYAIGGLHLLPVWFYMKMWRLYPRIKPCIQHIPTVLLASGRALCCCVELWFICDHMLSLAELSASEPNMEEEPQQVARQATQRRRKASPSREPPPRRSPKINPKRDMVKPAEDESEPGPSPRTKTAPKGKTPELSSKSRGDPKGAPVAISLPAGVPIPGQASPLPQTFPRQGREASPDRNAGADTANDNGRTQNETTERRGPLLRRFSRRR